jgi:hypothetical protein
MIEGQLIRTDRDMFTTARAPKPVRLDELRELFSPEEAKMFGIDRPYDREIEPVTPIRRLFDGLAATMATTFLFAGVGMLGIPSGAFA